MRSRTAFFPILLLTAYLFSFPAAGVTPLIYSDQQQPMNPGAVPNTVPAFPVVQAENQTACRLDLSDELFGGVAEACVHGGLDRSRCCPVLAAWLFAAHARSALEIHPPAADTAGGGGDGPMMPDDSQRCVDSLQTSLEARSIRLPRANATCDAVLCFCGIRLHQIGSLTCPAAFNVSGDGRNATPTAVVRDLEGHCRNASYSGCTRCLQSLEKLKGGGGDLDGGGGGGGDHGRASRMFGRDCQLMGLTWLLARNRTAYIPTVSAVLRAVLYSAHPPAVPYRCSPDQENMPLAVDSLQFQKIDSSSALAALPALVNSIYALLVLLVSLVVVVVG